MAIVTGMYLLRPVPVKCQYYFYNEDYLASSWLIETGISGGIMNCLTDLGGHKGIGRKFIKDLNWNASRACYNFFAGFNYQDVLGLFAEITIGNIFSSDKLLQKADPDLNGRYGRNLSFKSRILDLRFCAELHPLLFIHYSDNKTPLLSPYLLAGIGYYSFNPKASLENNWYALQPLRLEGQGSAWWPERKPYKLKQFNIPVGAGFRYEVNAVLYTRLEIVHRFLFTDYLDDVSTTYIDPFVFSIYLPPAQALIAQKLHNRMPELQPGYIVQNKMQRGDPTDRDAFFSIQVKVGYLMRKKK